jgi:hypothetical protein
VLIEMDSMASCKVIGNLLGSSLCLLLFLAWIKCGLFEC